jgi:integrase
MASIANDPGGRRRILFVAPDGSRKTVRLGKVSQRFAAGVKLRVEHLLAAKLTGQAPDADTARWVAGLDELLAERLAAVGLIPRTEPSEASSSTLAGFIAQYIADRPRMKPNTLKNYRQTERSLNEFFGPSRVLTSITPGDCDEWQARQVAAGFAPATIGRNVKRAKQFFRAAVRKKLLPENPAADLKAAAQVNKAREHYVSREDVDRIIAECPDAEWRLIVALARYGGLRTPSETFALTWADVDWERGRLTVRSPKTEHCPGGGSRLVPLFPELRPHLEAVFDAAEPGTVHVIAKHRLDSGNLRTQFERLMARAGVAQWPRLFQNMRASRETELAQEYPLHVVVTWIGNSAPIAARHYLQVTDADFDRASGGGAESGAQAAQKPAQQAHAGNRTKRTKTKQAPAKQGLVREVAGLCDLVQTCSVPPRGVEPRFSD